MTGARVSVLTLGLMAATLLAGGSAPVPAYNDPSAKEVGLREYLQTGFHESVTPLTLPAGAWRTIQTRAWAPKAYAVQLLPGHTLLMNLQTPPEITAPGTWIHPRRVDELPFAPDQLSGTYARYNRNAVHNPGTRPEWVLVTVDIPPGVQARMGGAPWDMRLAQVPTQQLRAEAAQLKLESLHFPASSQPTAGN